MSLGDFNHPLLFVFFMLLALWGFAAVATHVSKQAGAPGIASFFQTP